MFATAGKAVVEAKPIATPTIKYEIGPLLKDLMEWPSPPKSAYVIGELMAGNKPYGFDILSGRNNKNGKSRLVGEPSDRRLSSLVRRALLG